VHQQPLAIWGKLGMQRRVRQPLVVVLADKVWNDLDLVKIKRLDRCLL
jgi:hypothetical protein